MHTRDLIIIGSGPAGLTSAIYARRALLSTLVVEKEAFGGQVNLTSMVDNYPGVPNIDGYSLGEAMRSQAADLGAEFCQAEVTSVHKTSDGLFSVAMGAQEALARAVVYAAGSSPARAGFDAEERFFGRGVSYCATCDGMFYRNKLVFVVGGGNSAAEEALFLTKFASQVVVVVRKDHMRAQAGLVRELEDNPKVEIRYNTSIDGVGGGELLSKITLKDNLTGATHTESFDEGAFGVFVFVGMRPSVEPIAGLVDVDDSGHVITDEDLQSRTKGLFVAGDCRSKRLRQIVTAAADGAIAATAAEIRILDNISYVK